MNPSQDSASVQTTSVVIPVYNEEENLPELLRRLLAACREVEPWEIILVDDLSPDGSYAVII